MDWIRNLLDRTGASSSQGQSGYLNAVLLNPTVQKLKKRWFSIQAECFTIGLPWLAITLVVIFALSIKGPKWSLKILEQGLKFLDSLPAIPHSALLIALIFVPCVWLSIPGLGNTLQLYSGYRFYTAYQTSYIPVWPLAAFLTSIASATASLACFALARLYSTPRANQEQLEQEEQDLEDNSQAGAPSSTNKYLEWIRGISNSTRGVVLLRLSPFSPFTLISYLLGRTGISWWAYWFGTTAGIFPCSLLFAYFGSLAPSIAELVHAGGNTKRGGGEAAFHRGGAQIWKQVIIAAVAFTVFAIMGLAAHYFLNRTQHQDQEQSNTSSSPSLSKIGINEGDDDADDDDDDAVELEEAPRREPEEEEAEKEHLVELDNNEI